MGRLQWVRMDCDLDALPEVMAAGLVGTSIWLALARISGQFSLEGVIPAKFANALYLSRRLFAPVELIEEGINQMVASGLAERHDGSLVVDMERFISPSVTTMRERRSQEKRQRIEGGQNITAHNGDEPLLTVDNRYPTGQDKTGHNSTRQNSTRERGTDDQNEVPPQAAEPPATEPQKTRAKTNKPDPLKRITLNEVTWQFEGITDEDRSDWQRAAPAVHVDREIETLIARLQNRPGWLNERRKGGRWVSVIKAWMLKAQSFAEKGAGNVRSTPPKRWQDDPTRDRFGREYSSVALMREIEAKEAMGVSHE